MKCPFGGVAVRYPSLLQRGALLREAVEQVA